MEKIAQKYKVEWYSRNAGSKLRKAMDKKFRQMTTHTSWADDIQQSKKFSKLHEQIKKINNESKHLSFSFIPRVQKTGKKTGKYNLPSRRMLPLDRMLNNSHYVMTVKYTENVKKEKINKIFTGNIPFIGSMKNAKTNYNQFYSAMETLLRNYKISGVIDVEWDRQKIVRDLPAWTADQGNCVKNMLKSRFPSKADKLNQIELKENGSWMEEQSIQASKIIKRNLITKNAVGGDVCSVGNYKDNTHNDVNIVVCNQHCTSAVPSFPKRKNWKLSLIEYSTTSITRIYKEFDLKQSCSYLCGSCVVNEGGAIIKSREAHDEVVEIASKYKMDENNMMLTGSSFGVEFKHFKDLNDFQPTHKFNDNWAQSQIFCQPYNIQTRKPVHGIDGNSWYESFIHPESASYKMYKKHGIPKTGTEFLINSPSLEDIANQNGICLIKWIGKKHDFLNHQFGDQTWLPVPVVIFLANHCKFKIIQAVLVSEKQNMKYPEQYEKGDMRKMFGRLIACNDPRYMIVFDEQEKNSIVNSLFEEGKLASCSPVYDVIKKDLSGCGITNLNELMMQEDEPQDIAYWMVGIINDNTDRSCYHVHSYILGYAFISLCTELFKYKWADVVKIKTDSIYLYRTSQFKCNFGSNPGQFKHEDNYEYISYPIRSNQSHEAIPTTIDTTNKQIMDVNTFIGQHKHTLIESPAGHGKTYSIINALKDYKICVLVPTRNLRKYNKNKYGLKNCYTWQFALKPGSKFDPKAIQINLDSFDIVFWDEIGVVTEEELEPILKFLNTKNIRVIFSGDRKQLPPHTGTNPWGLLDKMPYLWLDTDYRSKDSVVASLKRELRGHTNKKALEILSKYIDATKIKELVKIWNPKDFILCSTHKMRDIITNILIKVHKKKYPNENIRIRFNNKSAKSGNIEYIKIDEKLPQNSEYLITSTFHVCQGMTIDLNQKMWICDDRLSEWCKHAVYMGSTRVEYLNQLGVISI